MQLHTQEHYDLMGHFERQFKGHRMDREARSDWGKQRIYQDGATNELFLAFRKGYALGKAVERSSTEA